MFTLERLFVAAWAWALANVDEANAQARRERGDESRPMPSESDDSPHRAGKNIQASKGHSDRRAA